MKEQNDGTDTRPLPHNVDARVWAREWLRTIEQNPQVPTDHDTMVTWFSNAIMAGYDDAMRKVQNDAIDDARRLRWLLDNGYAIVPDRGAASFAEKVFDDREEIDAFIAMAKKDNGGQT